MRLLFLLMLFVPPALAQEAIYALDRKPMPVGPTPASTTHELRLTFAYLEGAGWDKAAIAPLLSEGARILSQCGISIVEAELVRIAAPERFRLFTRPLADDLVRAVPLAKPTVYFLAETRARPAFDAEAIGRGNAGSRPALAGTVWITRAARDPGIVLAHELAHVLMNSGEHSQDLRNLMREDTQPDNIQLNVAQCLRLRASGTGNGLLRPR